MSIRQSSIDDFGLLYYGKCNNCDIEFVRVANGGEWEESETSVYRILDDMETYRSFYGEV